MPPRSKRQRKQKDKLSLRGKHPASNDDVFAVIGPTQGEDSNAFILPSRSEDPICSQAGEEEQPTKKKLSRSQQRKLRRVQEEKERRQQRALVMAKLSENQLKSEQLTLLRSVATKGQKESKKESLRRALQLERAGVIAGSNEKCSLYKERPQADASDEQLSDRDELTSEDERFSPALPSPTILPRLENSNPKEPALKRQRLQSDRASAIPAVAMDKDGQKAVVEKIKRTELGLGIEMANAESDEDVLARKRTSPTARRLAPQVSVLRPKAFAESRANLPVVGMEQEIMEAINENDVIVLCGETGSGKTTQVPQFLYEAGYGCANYPDRAGMVGITQPRRVAAVSTASRVAEEMGVDLGKTVGYHIRHDRKAGPETVLKFMTDGLLLRELQDDFLLSKYSAIIVDEAHERSLNTDILLGMLSRIVKLRRSMSEESSNNIAPLKLVIMSATLRIEDFVNNGRLFSTPPPVVNVPARQYPVTVHFSRKTELHDYVGAAFKKTCQIHRNLPPGGVLVFLTGRQEVEQMCRMLRQTFRVDNSRADNKSLRSDDEIQESQMALGAQEDGVAGDDGGADAAEDVEAYLDQGPGLQGQLGKRGELRDDYHDGSEDELRSEDDKEGEDEEDEVVVLGGGLPQEGSSTDPGEQNINGDDGPIASRVHVLPLYAMLPPAQQRQVFGPVPEGHRLIVVATNVAETSLTIPGIRYVVDCGRSKQRLLDAKGGVARFEVRWISKASAEQRAGRAGRVGAGHCYRIYSSAVYQDTFPQHTPPEIANVSLEGVVLLLKSLGVDAIQNFPFPSPPSPLALKSAIRCLTTLSAVDPATGGLTQMGKSMARFPIDPRHARMLLEVVSGINNLKSMKLSRGTMIGLGLALAAAMSIESPFVSITDGNGGDNDPGKEETKVVRKELRKAQKELRMLDSDPLSALSALCAFEASGSSAEVFCRQRKLHYRNLKEAAALRKQLVRIYASSFCTQLEITPIDKESLLAWQPQPSNVQDPFASIVLRRAIAAGWADRVARRRYSNINHDPSKARRKSVRYQVGSIDMDDMDEDVFLHSQSSLGVLAPEYVVYTDMVRSLAADKPCMVGVTAIEPQWLPSVATSLCRFSEPLTDPPPRYDASSDRVLVWKHITFGKHDWQLPDAMFLHPDAQERAAIFAAALLDGRVVKEFSMLRPHLALPPSMAAKPEMRGHRKVGELIHALEARGVDSKASLVDAWSSDPLFLRRELGVWMKKDAEHLLHRAWSSLLQELSKI